jgi:alkyl sulfatase BDS1-like metallo-beta-lactamase superfamily hydrolase
VARTANLVADTFARVVRASSPRTRALLGRGPGGRILVGGIFTAMAGRFNGAAAAELDTVVRWELADDRSRDVAISNGRCRVVRRADREPELTLALDRLGLLELATGVANGPQMYFSGRLTIHGNLMLAQQLTAVFAVPGGGPPG